MGSNNLPDKAKKLIDNTAAMFDDLCNDHGELTDDSMNRYEDQVGRQAIREKFSEVCSEISRFYIENANDLESEEMHRFSESVFYSLCSNLPFEMQTDGAVLRVILAMIKTASFIAFMAGKSEKTKNALENDGFSEELEAGFNVKDWARIVKENE